MRRLDRVGSSVESWWSTLLSLLCLLVPASFAPLRFLALFGLLAGRARLIRLRFLLNGREGDAACLLKQIHLLLNFSLFEVLLPALLQLLIFPLLFTVSYGVP